MGEKFSSFSASRFSVEQFALPRSSFFIIFMLQLGRRAQLISCLIIFCMSVRSAEDEAHSIDVGDGGPSMYDGLWGL